MESLFSMAWWVWVLLGLALVLFEMVTPGGFYFIFFGVSAIVVGFVAAAGLGGPSWFEWLMFSVLAVVTTAVFRHPLLKRFGASVPTAEVDSLIGQTATAMETLPAGGFGKVELRGSAWNARNTGVEPVEAGGRCLVEQVDGLMLMIRSAAALEAERREKP